MFPGPRVTIFVVVQISKPALPVSPRKEFDSFVGVVLFISVILVD